MKLWIPLLTTLLALPQSGLAEAYKCRLPDGRIEFSDTGCPNSSTLSVRRDETVSPENRAQAEREVERMRQYVEQREAAGRTAAPNLPAASSKTETAAPPPASVEACLRELERQAMEAGKRAEMEASCRSTGKSQAVAENIPAYPVGNSVSQCIRNVDRQPLPAAERARRIDQCQGIYPPPPPRPATPVKPPEKPVVVDCPAGKKTCYR